MDTNDINEIRNILKYDPETGLFTWLDDRRKRVSVGSVAGTIDKQGYIRIKFSSREYRAHRLAFLFMTGKIPEYVDHVNRIRNDNRWENLRPCTSSQNLCNREMSNKNKTGVTGVSWCKRRSTWAVKVKYSGKVFKRTFKDFELAELVAIEARIKFHGEFTADNNNAPQ